MACTVPYAIIKRMGSPVRFAVIKRLFLRHASHLVRVSGSHHVFESPTGRIYPVPVHRGLVRYEYYKEIRKILGADED